MQYTAALVGNPNSGKTTLFNRLTGSNQYVGNWPGVTVEKKMGKVIGASVVITDLPGIYSLSPYSIEEIVSRDYILEEHPDAIISIVDGTNIERNLYLTLQLIELGLPLVIAVNMADELAENGIDIDYAALSETLGVSVIPISAKKGDNVDLLLREIEHLCNHKHEPAHSVGYDSETLAALEKIIFLLAEKIKGPKEYFYASKLLEGDEDIEKKLSLSYSQIEAVRAISKSYEDTSALGDCETMLADSRYKYIERLMARTVKRKSKTHKTLTEKIDDIVTNRILALPIFILTIALVFMITFGEPGSFLLGLAETLVDWLSGVVEGLLVAAEAPEWTISLVTGAVFGGVGGIVAFLPQISILFLFLSLLEDSGYMARAAFIMDRILHKIGLSGKSFIPMLMGFGCSVPAVMAARTMENERDRRMTIMLTPFMSCGARLPIYALFAGIFFAESAGLVVFSMYMIGMIVAVLSGFLLKNTLFKGEHPPFLMELPPYRIPDLKTTLMHMWEKSKGFLIKAGMVIFPMSVLVWVLQSFNLSFEFADITDSMLASLGRAIAPVFAPLGFGNWQMSISILTGFIAKEAVVSTTEVLFAGQDLEVALAQMMTPVSAFAMMTFTLLYMPCIAAFAAIKREMNSWRWAIGTVAFQTAVAYVVSLLVVLIGGLF